jgi:pimeloyl-ACP methyl ester carboxylesterase
MFHPQLHIWKEQFNTLLLDLPGFGYSPANGEFTMESYVNPIRLLVEKYKIDPKHTVFYGISFGGLVALEYSKKYHVNQIVFESTPFTHKMLTTNEFAVLDILKSITGGTGAMGLFQQQIRENEYFQQLILAIYRMVMPKSKYVVNYDEMLFFMKHIDMNIFFEVANYIRNVNLYKDLKSNNSNKVFLVDKFDPTVSYKYFRKEIARFGKNIVTEYEIHAPSAIFGKVTAPLLIEAVL